RFTRILRNGYDMLTEKGEVHVTQKTAYPFHLWEIEKLGQEVGLGELTRQISISGMTLVIETREEIDAEATSLFLLENPGPSSLSNISIYVSVMSKNETVLMCN
ncbi:hypothetical protein Pfo_013426, partial [Paulownia fortunei]